MGPVLSPQCKGRVPLYSRDKLIELQQTFDDLEEQGVNVTAEYLNPSFLVKNPSGGFQLVTVFSDVGRYSKPQPSLMPDVDLTLRTVAQWKYIIKTDLTNAFYQMPNQSMKYCGVATPFRGMRVYTRCAMGMPGVETALEELMCRVMGNFIQEGSVAKLADDLYCGGIILKNCCLHGKRFFRNYKNAIYNFHPPRPLYVHALQQFLGGYGPREFCLQAPILYHFHENPST